MPKTQRLKEICMEYFITKWSSFNYCIKPSSFLCTQHCDCLIVWNTDYPFPCGGMTKITSQKYRGELQSSLSAVGDAKQSQIFPHLKLNLSSFHTLSSVLVTLLVSLLHTSTGSSLNYNFHICSIFHKLHPFTILHLQSLTSCICLDVVHADTSFV